MTRPIIHPVLRERTITPLTALFTVLLSLLAAPGVAILSFLVW